MVVSSDTPRKAAEARRIPVWVARECGFDGFEQRGLLFVARVRDDGRIALGARAQVQ